MEYFQEKERKDKIKKHASKFQLHLKQNLRFYKRDHHTYKPQHFQDYMYVYTTLATKISGKHSKFH